MAEVASESWWIKLGVMYDKSGFKAAIGGMADLKRIASNLADTFKKVVDANSDLYLTSKYLNISSSQLQVWERTFKFIGGSAEEARQNIENLNYAYDELRLGMGGQKAEIAARLHLRPDDLLDFDTAMKALNESFNTYFEGDRGIFTPLVKQLGLSESAIHLVTTSVEEYQHRIAKARSISIIPERQLEAARKLNEQFIKLSINWDNFKSRLLSASFPALSKLMGDIERALLNPNLEKNLVKLFDVIETELNKLANDKKVEEFISNLSIISEAAVRVAGWTVKGVGATVKAAQEAGGAVGEVVGEAEAGHWNNLAYMFGLDLMVDKLKNAFTPNSTPSKAAPRNTNVTINVNGAQNPQAVANDTVEKIRTVETMENTRTI